MNPSGAKEAEAEQRSFSVPAAAQMSGMSSMTRYRAIAATWTRDGA